MKCPHCRSKDTAKILYGLPVMNEDLSLKLALGKVHLGGCGIRLVSPERYCNDCEKEFAAPPLVLKKEQTEMETVDLREDISKIIFSIGGYFEGHDYVEISKSASSVQLLMEHKPDDNHLLNRTFSDEEWSELLNKLFCKLFIHEWQRNYSDPEILDGEQWFLEVHFNDNEPIEIGGSNAYPPLWKELKNVFRLFFKEAGIKLISNH